MIRKLTNNGKTTLLVDVSYRLPSGETKRVRKVSPVPTMRGAKAYEKQILKELHDGTYRRKEEQKPTLNEFAPRFLKWSERDENKPSELTKKRTILKKHILPALGRNRLDEIDGQTLKLFLTRLRETPSPRRAGAPEGEARYLSAKTIRNIMGVLGRVLRQAADLGFIKAAPPVPMPKAPPHEPDWLTGEEVQRLLSATELKWKPMVAFAVSTGLRRGELLGLMWSDVDWERQTVRVSRQISEGKVVTTKSNRTRVVALIPGAIEALGALPRRNGGYVFSREDGKPLSRDMIKRPLKRAMKVAGLQILSPGPGQKLRTGEGWHILRHTFASMLVAEGVPLAIIQQLLGHSTIKMTEKYAHLQPTGQHAAVEVLTKWVTPFLGDGKPLMLTEGEPLATE